ncbi:putative RAN protein binding protein [Dioszegia hungarica]|uniref:RAN protein binding protein n=1 Tax=Dioszegia hungarica TaxID=4972 RepID=A0AA38LVY5_9TREE|nr:putative RAN protein binding protein [Dioszegia hungarica]KAI9638367.1 putative RAN protein binding protein [Dioszegia hungarica]
MSAPHVNGNGNGHPAAPIPAAESSATQSKVQPNDVGWQFVPQYYNFVNKQPHRLHCFYNKRSTFIHGEEGEEAQVALGQQEIHARITSIGYDQCKVYIHQIDSQSSANGGIIILVIGEMSNMNGPWRKFTQTFFLAEQPNGYFVLNDIFRYLKEEVDDEDDDEETTVASTTPAKDKEVSAPVEQAPAPVEVKATEEIVAPVDNDVEEKAAAPVEEEKEEEVAEAPAADVGSGPEPTSEPAQVDQATVPEEAVIASVPDKDIAPSEPAQAVEEPTTSTPSAEESAPAPEQPAANGAPKAAPPAAAPAAPAAPAKPKGPMSWAAIARPTAAANAPAVSAPPAAAPKAVQVAPAQAEQANGSAPSASSSGPKSTAVENAMRVKTSHCFVKLPNWAANDQSGEPMDENSLRAAASRFGEVSKVEIVGNKACAFVEFKSIQSATKAIIASLQTNQGGEGGVKVQGQSGSLIFETRKEKDERRMKGPGGGQQGPVGGERQMNGGGERGRGGMGGGRGGGRGGAMGGQGGQQQQQQGSDGFVERTSGRGGRGGRGRGGAPQGDRQQK